MPPHRARVRLVARDVWGVQVPSSNLGCPTMLKDEQALSCPRDWVKRYKAYMEKHNIPYRREKIGGIMCFVFPKKYRPHAWRNI